MVVLRHGGKAMAGCGMTGIKFLDHMGMKSGSYSRWTRADLFTLNLCGLLFLPGLTGTEAVLPLRIPQGVPI